MYKRILSCIIAFLILFESIMPSYAANITDAKGNNQVNQEYIIKYKDGFNAASANKELKEKNIKPFENIKKLNDDEYGLVSLPNTNDVKGYIENVTNSDAVEYLVPDTEVHIFEDNNATEINQNYILEKYESFANFYQYKQSKPIIIAVADTGIDFKTCNNVFINDKEVKTNGKDDDGNSYKDDINGWNFTDFNNITNTNETHGTVISSIINKCIPDAEILPLKVVKNGTAHTSDLIDAIKYADSIRADIMNCSWGASEYNYALKDAMAGSHMLFICAADNASDKISYPASFGLDNIISVGKMDTKQSTDVNFVTEDIKAKGSGNIEGTFSGTSYATAYITAAMSMVMNSVEEDVSATVYGNALRNSFKNSQDNSRLFDFDTKFNNILGYIKENKNAEVLMDIANALRLEIPEDLKYLLVNGKKDLSSEEINKITEYFHVEWTQLKELLQNGFDLATSVSAMIYAQNRGIGAESATALCNRLGDYKQYRKNLDELKNLSDRLQIPMEELEKCTSYITKELSLMDITGAVIISNLQGLDLSKIINSNTKNALSHIDFSKAQIIESNKTSYIRLLLEFNLSQQGLDDYIKNEKLDCNLLLNVVLQWQHEKNFYINDTQVDTYGNSNLDSSNVYNKYQMPSTHNNLDDISVSDLYGMVSYKKNLLSLSGKNGLDLDFGLRYDEDDALGNCAYGDIDKLSSIYCAEYRVDCYRNEDIEFNDPIYTYGLKWGNMYTDESLHNSMLQVTSWEDASYTYIVKDAKIIVVDSEYNHVEGQRSKSFYQELYSLGPGWSFNFPAIEDNINIINGKAFGKMVLHFSDGQAYTVKENSGTSTYSLSGYAYQDINLSVVDASMFVSGNRSSHWMVSYKSGKRDFFDSTGRYIGSAGVNIGPNTERMEVHYNENGYVNEIVDSVKRSIYIDYGITSTYSQSLEKIVNSRNIDFIFYDVNEEAGKKLYSIEQSFDDNINGYSIKAVHTYDNLNKKIKSTNYCYWDYDTNFLYNFRGSYISDYDSKFHVYKSKSPVLMTISDSVYDSVNGGNIGTTPITTIEYSYNYRNISNASCASYPRVSSIYNYDFIFDEYGNDGPGITTQNKKDYVYEIIDSNHNTYTNFVMNGWNDTNIFNENNKGSGYFYPKNYGYQYAFTVKETQDSNGNFCKATTNYYNDDRRLEKICNFTLDSGDKKLYSKTDIEYANNSPRKEITRRYGKGIELCLVKETNYDSFANIIESHVYSGTSQNGGAIQNIKKQEDLYRTFGDGQFIPTREEAVLCDASGNNKIITENALSPVQNDIWTQAVYKMTGTIKEAISRKQFVYDGNFFNIKKITEEDASCYGNIKETVFDYDKKYGIYKTNVIHNNKVAGNVTKESDYSYKYDNFGRVTDLGNSGRWTYYQYDNLNAVTYTQLPNFVQSYQDIDYKNNTVIYTTSAFTHANYTEEGTKLKYVYNKFGKLVEEYIDNEYGSFQLSKKYEYDRNNRLIATYQYKNEIGTEYTKIIKSYDALDRITAIKTYDTANNLLSREEYNYEIALYNQMPCEKQTITTYNGSGLPSRNIEYIDSSGNKIAQQTEFAQNQFYTDTYTYGNYGYLISQQGDTIDKKDFLYDVAGNLIKETDGNNNSKTYSYDAFKRVRLVQNEKGESTFYDYDSLDRLTQIRQFVGTTKVIRDGKEYDDPYYSITLYEYDIYGNKVKEKKSNSELGAPLTFSGKRYTYDRNNQLIMVQEGNPDSNIGSLYTQYYYNMSGKIIREYTGLTAPLNITGPDEYIMTSDTDFSVKKYEYDYRGNLSRITFPEGNQESYTYSFHNLLLSKSINNIKVMQYSYDALGRLSKEYSDSSNYKNYTYDTVGNILSVNDSNETISYTYNLIGNPLTETRSTTQDDSDYVKTYAYSPRGISEFTLSMMNNEKNDYEEKYYQSYVYDSFGRILSTNQKNSKTASINYAINYKYDVVGSIESENVVSPNYSTTKTMAYNGLGQIIKSSQAITGSSQVDTSNYKYRLDGNMSEKVEAQIRTNYFYDYFDRLTRVTSRNKLSNSLLEGYEYNYDENSNCIEKIYTDSYGNQIDQVLIYNTSNRLINKITEYLEEDATVKKDNDIYSYDVRGNCISNTKAYAGTAIQTISYQYDAFNQFAGSKTDNVQTYSYEYDVLGNRVAKSTYNAGVKNNTISHFWFGDDIIADKNNANNSLTSYVFGNGLCGMINNSTQYVYNSNAHGDVVEIQGNNLGNDNTYTYDAYGNSPQSSKSLVNGNPYRYAGYYYDNESGFYYLKGRYYNPVNATFTQRDTYAGKISTPSTLNAYMYCGANPILYTDPTGHFFDTLLDIASVGISAYDFIKHPTLSNGLFLAADVVALAVPFIPATGVARAAKRAYNTINACVDAANVLRRADKVYDTAKVAHSVLDTYRELDKAEDAIHAVASVSGKIACHSDEAAEAIKLANAEIKAKNKAELIESINKSRGSTVFDGVKGGSETTKLYHSAGENIVDLIKDNGFRTDLPNPQAAFHNNRFGRGVYLADSPATALAERPGGVIIEVDAMLGKNLNIIQRGIVDYDMAHSITRGARKHGFDSITFNSAQLEGGINTVIFNPKNVIMRR